MLALHMTSSPGMRARAEPHEALARCLRRIARSRDREAFEELFSYYGPRLKTLMIRAGLETPAAEDLVQEIMLTVWSKAALYDAERGTVSAWIFRIARNAKIDRLRRRGALPLDIMELELPSDEPGAEQSVADEQSRRWVVEALACLPAEQMEVIELAFVRDLSQSEIASKLSIPLGTVKSRMRLAYQKLRDALEGLR